MREPLFVGGSVRILRKYWTLWRVVVEKNGIKQCRHYIHWMFNECEQAEIRVTPKLHINHHANNDRFKEKTIYGELSAMRTRGLLATVQPYGEGLTLFCRK